MKIRTDFVTNSSSSAFVLLIKKDELDSIKDQLTKDMKTVFAALATEDKVFGIPAYKISKIDTHGGSDWDGLDIKVKDKDGWEVVYSAFEARLTEKGVSTWYEYVDF